MNLEFRRVLFRSHFLRQLFLKERNHNLISGKDDVTYFVFADNLSQAFNDLFGVLLMRVPHTPLVACLRPSADLDSMNFLAFHLLRAERLAKPEDEDTRGVRIRKHGSVPRVLFVEMGQMIQMRLVVSVDAVIVDRG